MSTVQKRTDFQPILLGTDFNCYGMARSFYQQYGIKSIAYGVTRLAPTRYTKLVDVRILEGFDEDPGFMEGMRKIAANLDPNKKYLLLSCGDGYTELIARHLDELKKHFICPYVDIDLFNRLGTKETFYEAAEKYGLPYPKTKIITKEEVESGKKIELPFDFPIAFKPSDSVQWNDIQFEGRKKAYVLDKREQFDELLPKVYKAGYTGKMIAQDFIPGDDSNMRTLNAYVDSNHNVRLLSLAHPLLEDPSPVAVGNYMVILPEKDMHLYKVIQKFLEEVKYVGFADFDMKWDSRDNEFKIFEINLRQGRSSYYCTLNGYNLAKYVVDDVIDHKPYTGTDYADGDMLWMNGPKEVFYKYAKENKYKERAKKLIEEGKWGTTAFDKNDTFRQHMLMRHAFSIISKNYKKYFVQR